MFLTGRMGQVSCIVLFTSLHILLMGFMSSAHSLMPARSVAVTEIYMNHESRSGQDGTRLLCWYKTVLQQSSLHSSKCAYTEDCLGALLFDEALQPLHWRSSPNSGQVTTVLMGHHILRVIMLCP